MSHRKRDGSKLSFSELDKLRRERKHGGGGPDRDARPRSTHAQKSYRAALERAFDSGKLAEFAATMQRARDPLRDSLATAPRASAHGANPGNPGSDGKPEPARPAASGTDAPAPGAGGRPAPQAGAPDGGAPGEPTPDSPGDSPGDAPGAAPDATAPEQPVIEPAAPPLPRTSERAERRRLAKKITDATSPRDMGKAVDRYLARFDSLPEDYEALEKILSHPRSRVVLQALEALETCIAKQKPRRSRSLSVQLSILEDTHDDAEVRERAARVRAAL